MPSTIKHGNVKLEWTQPHHGALTSIESCSTGRAIERSSERPNARMRERTNAMLPIMLRLILSLSDCNPKMELRAYSTLQSIPSSTSVYMRIVQSTEHAAAVGIAR